VAAAEMAVERIHGGKNELVVHLDVDVIASEDFQATDLPGARGLRLEEVRQALEVFAKQGRLVAFEVASYNPERDSDGRGARIVVDLIAAALGARLQSQAEPATVAADVAATSAAAAVPAEPPANESPATDSPEQATSASGE